ncbi:MAG: hypothetical protein IJY73_08805 [Oscillospiraceae bacterium]|nr:hypothetical protein [Oscillospiraceae bacterium]
MFFSGLMASLTGKLLKSAAENNREILPSEKQQKEFDAWATLFPNIIGAVFGCAVARMFSLEISYYPAFAIIFAFIIGVAKHCIFDNVRFMTAVVENFIVTAAFAVICFLVSLSRT